MNTETVPTQSFDPVSRAKDLRLLVENVKNEVLGLKQDIQCDKNDSSNCDKGEAIANATLAFRHLEDAKMRLGKVIQAYEGQSVYDK